MDYKNKYLKYKNKYLELKKQSGSGKYSHRLVDKRLYKYIGTYETSEERAIRERQNIEPVDGYKIWNSIDEIIMLNYNTIISDNTRRQFINTLTFNLNNLFGYSFNLMQDNGSELLYIDAKGDGNCFLNSLFIYTLMTQKNMIVYDLYKLTGVSNLHYANFDDFKYSILFLSDTIIDRMEMDWGNEFAKLIKLELRNSDIPNTQILGQVYADNFNTRIMVIQVDDQYRFNYISANISPEVTNASTDSLILIQKGNVHFGLLIPSKNDFRLRKELFDYLTNYLRH